jgi:GT2 family glycosyltransferase
MFPEDLSDGQTVYAVCGACIAFRAEAFREIGGFDENTFLFEEEFIIAERLLMKGWVTVVTTSSRYFHLEGLSTVQTPYRRRLHFFRSENYLLRRYYGWNRAACALMRAYRFAELGAFCLYWPLTKAKRLRAMLRRAELLRQSTARM